MLRFSAFSKRLITALLIIIVLAVVGSGIVLAVRSGQTIELAAPTSTCPVILEWRGIYPGISTKQDVQTLLGTPDTRGRQKFSNGETISYFGYQVEGGKIAEFAQHRIFFRPNGTVDWIEVIIADSDGQYHPAQEMITQLGYTLDIVYTNNNYNPYAEFQYDVLGGPDDILVWSECGMAMSVLRSSRWQIEEYPRSVRELNLRHKNLSSMDSSADELTTRSLNGVVMLHFLFQPTDYDSFREHYKYHIPYGLWDGYLAKLR